MRTVMTINHPERDPAGSQLSLFPPKRRAGWLTMIHVAFLSSQLPPRGKHEKEREKTQRGRQDASQWSEGTILGV